MTFVTFIFRVTTPVVALLSLFYIQNPVLADPLQEASNEGFGRGISAGASFIFISVYCNLVRDQLLSVDEAQSHMDQLIKDSTPGLFQAELINDSAIKNDCKLTVSSP